VFVDVKRYILVLVASANALACSVFPHVHKVSRSFAVHVSNDVGPVAGLKLKVSRFKNDEFLKLTDEQQRTADPAKFEEIFAESVTDSSGMAQFKIDKAGAFTLSLVSPASQLDWVELDVSGRSSSLSSVVELRWPSFAILRTTHLHGKLMKGLFSSRSVPLEDNALKLHTLTDYREVAATQTDHNGEFDFKGIAPGLYLIQIIATDKKTDDFYKSEGNIAVFVSPDAQRDALEISIANTSCGLSYDFQANKARYKPEVCFKGGKPVQCDY
jgi:hypothetical protein